MLFIRKKNQYDNSIKTYSPMGFWSRCIYFLLILLGLFTVYRYAAWWFQPSHVPANWLHGAYSEFHFFDFVVFSFLSFAVFFGLFLKIGTWFTIWFIKRPVFTQPSQNLHVAFLTCYVPGKEPISMLEKTLIAMRDAEYPHDTWVLDEGNSVEVQELCVALGVFHFSRKDVLSYNQNSGPYRIKTKAGNLNAWRDNFEDTYDVVAQVDMDHVPVKNYLVRQLGYFSDPKVGYVVIPQVYKNTNNWIAKGASEQTHFYYGPLQQGLYGSHMPFLIGTTHIYRVSAMKGFGGYAPTIAEDYLTSMHFSSNGWKGVYVPEILAQGEGPTNWTDYFNQQMRWSYGLYEILFKHTHRHFFKLSVLQKINIFFSQLFYFSGLTTFFGFFLTSLYLLFGINSTNMNIVQWSLYAIPAYLSGFLIILFLHRYYIDPKKEPSIGISGILLGYAASVIYVVALWKFLTKGRLTYQVTSKGEQAKSNSHIGVFVPYIFILLTSIATFSLSFIDGHSSLVMRFWAGLTIFLFSTLLLSEVFGNVVILAKRIFHKKEIKENSTLDLDYDKYGYVIRHPLYLRVLYIIGILSWTCTLYGFSLFLNINPWYWLFFGPVLGIISIHNYLNYVINIFYKRFDVPKHEALKKNYWEKMSLTPPSVDIFLPVCGEKIDILKNTFAAVQRVTYQNKQVFVLDDKGESKVAELAFTYGFTYLSRPNKGEMKKAGNLLYGFQHGRGDFYAVFDADFCPHPDFINDLLPYMYDEKVGIVQSPHYFGITSDIHKKSAIEYGSANLQEQFFRTIQVARDRFGGAICAGSNTIYRRSALEKNGGPTQVDHGEDVNTGIDIISLGYKIKYVPVILAKGLSPDTLPAFYKQQNRWASSSAGLLLSGRIFSSRLTFFQKLCYLSGITYYLSQLAYFLLPLQLFLVLGFHIQTINFIHALPFFPYMFFSMILLPLFSRKSKPKLGTYLATMSSVYVHCYTVILRFLGKPAQWVPTNAIQKKLEFGFIFLNEFSLFFLTCYVLSVSFLIYSGHLPVLNGLYITILFWIFWNVGMHILYFYNTYAVVYEHKIAEALIHLSNKRQFHFWRLRTIGTFLGVFLILDACLSYTAGASNGKTLFATHEEIVARDNISPSKEVAIADPRKNDSKQVLGASTVQSQSAVYTQIASPGDSLTTMVRRMLDVYVAQSEDILTPKQKRYVEVNLVAQLPRKPLRVNDSITISKLQMIAAVVKSKTR